MQSLPQRGCEEEDPVSMEVPKGGFYLLSLETHSCGSCNNDHPYRYSKDTVENLLKHSHKSSFITDPMSRETIYTVRQFPSGNILNIENRKLCVNVKARGKEFHIPESLAQCPIIGYREEYSKQIRAQSTIAYVDTPVFVHKKPKLFFKVAGAFMRYQGVSSGTDNTVSSHLRKPSRLQRLTDVELDYSL